MIVNSFPCCILPVIHTVDIDISQAFRGFKIVGYLVLSNVFAKYSILKNCRYCKLIWNIGDLQKVEISSCQSKV